MKSYFTSDYMMNEHPQIAITMPRKSTIARQDRAQHLLVIWVASRAVNF